MSGREISVYRNITIIFDQVNTQPLLKDNIVRKRQVCVINDPLGQTQSLASSDFYFILKFVLFCDILKSGDGGK